jgi:hypothetical protein
MKAVPFHDAGWVDVNFISYISDKVRILCQDIPVSDDEFPDRLKSCRASRNSLEEA